MLDSQFKNFAHIVAPGDSVATNGNIIPNSGGYRPDISIKNSSGIIHLILESERKSERKAFIGAMIHAAKYAETLKTPITLVFIMKETGNQTTVKQIADNIRPYFQWVTSLGAICLNKVFLLSDVAYDNSASAGEMLLSQPFLSRCTAL
jgi:hypothetical protein